MTNRVIDISTSPSRLSVRHRQLVIQTEGRDDYLVPFEDIGLILINHPAVTLTKAVLIELAKNKAALIACDTAQMPTSLTLPFAANQLQGERLRAQIAMSRPLRKRLWQQIITAKIRLQGEVLYKIKGSSFGLDSVCKRVQSGDKTNLEAQAAQRYWPRLFGKTFRRNRFGDGPNALLNFGYSVVRSATARSLCMSGLHAGIGLFHHNRSNSFPLADDIMEIWRPFIDFRVYQITSQDGLPDKDITPQIKAELLSTLNMAVPIGEEKLPFDLAIQRCSASLAMSIAKHKADLTVPSGLFSDQAEMSL